MSSREEALRRILDVAAAGRLNEDQSRELASHLEDAVEMKMAVGTPEMEAVAQALQEMGDVQKIARSFPAAGKTAVTPEGWLWRTWSLESGYLLLLMVVGMLAFVGPAIYGLFEAYRVPMPTLSLFFIDIGRGLREYWPLALPVLLSVGWGVWLLRRTKIHRGLGIAFSLLSTALCVTAIVALTLPFLVLFEGISQR